MSNPLLNRLRIPGSTYRLPSRGLFYTNGELSPDVKDGEVEVLPMTAVDEITLSTPDKLLSGKAVIEVLERRVPQVLNPGALLAKDVDFLMVCLRLVSFGSTTSIEFNHGCKEDSKDHEYEVNIEKMVASVAQIDPTLMEGEYTFVCENGQKVHFKPFTYTSVLKFHELTALMKEEDANPDSMEKLIVGTLAHAIADVDGISDGHLIEEWVATIPLGWKRQLESHIQLMSEWGVNSTITTKCKDCGEQINIPMSFNPVGFFT